MNIYTQILITIFLFGSCTDNKTYFIVNEKNTNKLNMINGHNDSIQIKNNNKPKVFFAIDIECPLCVSYTKTINELYENFHHNIDFYAFLPSSVYSSEKTNTFIEKTEFQTPLIVDTNQVLTYFLDATITPECFLTDKNFNIIYQGLIDDWIKELGRKGQYINNYYLINAITNHIDNKKVEINKTNAIGCIIERIQ